MKLSYTAAALTFFLIPFVLGWGDSGPNILLVLSDDHSVPHLSSYGNLEVKTPVLEAFAEEGMQFSRMYTTSPQCAPSRSSFAAGRSPIALRTDRFAAPLPLGVATFYELLRDSGYFTGFAGRSHHLDGSAPGLMAPTTERLFQEGNRITMPSRLDFHESGNQQLGLDQFPVFLDRVPEGKPFFIQIGFTDPHRPFTATKIHDPAKLTLPPHFPDTPEIREDFAAYYDEITHMDSDVGVLLGELERRDLDGDTVVIFLGDNGAALLRGKGTLYELGLNVPLIVRWPGVVEPSTRSDALLSGEDLAPTLLEIAGQEPLESMTGQSFLPVLKNATHPGRREVFAVRGAHGGGARVASPAAWDLSRAVITDRYKLIYNAFPERSYVPVDFVNRPAWKSILTLQASSELESKYEEMYFPQRRPIFEVYDLVEDPGEERNLSGLPEYADLVLDLKRRLHEWMFVEGDSVPLPIHRSDEQQKER